MNFQILHLVILCVCIHYTHAQDTGYCKPGWTFKQLEGAEVGHCYRYDGGGNPVTWERAHERCEAEGGHLTSIHSTAENLFLQDLVGGSRKFWIGLSDLAKEGDYQWTDNTLTDFTAWGEGQPDNSDKQDCVEFGANGPGAWGDQLCNISNAYVCKRREDDKPEVTYGGLTIGELVATIVLPTLFFVITTIILIATDCCSKCRNG